MAAPQARRNLLATGNTAKGGVPAAALDTSDAFWVNRGLVIRNCMRF
jgi:hypothetical protein